MLDDEFIKHFDHISRPVTTSWTDAEALSGKFIDDTQYPDALPVGCLVMHEVPAPDLIGHGGTKSLACALLNPSCPTLLLSDLQSVATSHPLDSLRVDLLPVTLQKCGDSPVSVARLVFAESHDVALQLAAGR